VKVCARHQQAYDQQCPYCEAPIDDRAALDDEVDRVAPGLEAKLKAAWKRTADKMTRVAQGEKK
jgi:hypothetical protein